MKGKMTARLLDKDGVCYDTFETDNIVVNSGESNLAAFMAENNTATLYLMKYMAIGTGTTPPDEIQTALVNEVGVRITGVKSASGSVYQVVATFPTNNPTTEVAITELGLFNQLGAGGTMLNRLKFGVITKGTADQIEFTVQISID
ncbi:hypothetical protein KKC52_12595 [bacterium]|nr:hypothetical protein [bacterium]